MTLWGLRVGACAALVGTLHACRSQPSTDGAGDQRGAITGVAGGCAPGRPTCPCGTEGQSVSCGEFVARSGDYVTCAMGTTTCIAGKWGPCNAGDIITKSLSSKTLGAGGLSIQSYLQSCVPDAGEDDQVMCDPNACMDTISKPPDVTDTDGAPTLDQDGAVAVKPSNMPVFCTGLQCQLATCPPGSQTKLTGIVYDPAGKAPVYDASVYIPLDPTAPLPAFESSSCGSCAGAAPVQALAVAETDANGAFTLTNVPSTDVGPMQPIPLVVQRGRWRREMLLTTVPKCTSTTVPVDQSRLPQSHTDGNGGTADLPRMAIATAAQDPLECLLQRMGVDPSEFQVPGSGNGRIDFYRKNGLDLASNSVPAGTPVAPDATMLYGSVNSLTPYDAVLLPCPGFEDDGDNAYADNVSAYANGGGRLYTAHYGYTWLTTPTSGVAQAVNPASGKPNPFFGVANWELDGVQYLTGQATIVDTFLSGGAPYPKGMAFSDWLNNVHALVGNALYVNNPHHNMGSVIAPTTQRIHNSFLPGEPFLMSFDTPFPLQAPPADAGTPDAGDGGDAGAGGACGQVVFSDFHLSTSELTAANGSCDSTADCGPGATCNLGSPGTCVVVPCEQSSDCQPGYSCVSARVGVCPDGAMACYSADDCPDHGTCSGGQAGFCDKGCATDADCSGQLCLSGHCNGCHTPMDCPGSGNCSMASPGTCTMSANTFPLACRQAPLDPQELALEFVLLDLTSCNAPDAVAVQLPAPVAPIYSQPSTFTEDFTRECPTTTADGGFLTVPGDERSETKVVWRYLDGQATVPSNASIDVIAQTVDDSPDGGPPDFSNAQVITLPPITASGPYSYPLDTGLTPPPPGFFNSASPPVVSGQHLRLTFTLNPTSDQSGAPTLDRWQVRSDCVPIE